MDDGERDRGGDGATGSPQGAQVPARPSTPSSRPRSRRKSSRLPTSDSVDRYELGRVVGAGAFGEVRLGHVISTGEECAVKKIPKAGLSPRVLEDLRGEARILQKLDHPNVTGFKSFFETEDDVYIVMEFVPGGDLRAKFKQGPLSEPQAAMMMQKLLEAVDHLHTQSVVHRDLKPENVLLMDPADATSVRIADFGLSNFKENEQKRGLSQTCGTMAYMAPEVLDDRPLYTSEVDIWSCGCIMFIALVGKHPFHESGLPNKELCDRIRNAQYDVPDHISSDAVDLLTRLLKRNPNNRYTASEALQHPWITGRKSDSAVETVLDMMRMFEAERRLKKAFHTSIAIVRFCAIVKRLRGKEVEKLPPDPELMKELEAIKQEKLRKEREAREEAARVRKNSVASITEREIMSPQELFGTIRSRQRSADPTVRRRRQTVGNLTIDLVGGSNHSSPMGSPIAPFGQGPKVGRRVSQSAASSDQPANGGGFRRVAAEIDVPRRRNGRARTYIGSDGVRLPQSNPGTPKSSPMVTPLASPRTPPAASGTSRYASGILRRDREPRSSPLDRRPPPAAQRVSPRTSLLPPTQQKRSLTPSPSSGNELSPKDDFELPSLTKGQDISA